MNPAPARPHPLLVPQILADALASTGTCAELFAAEVASEFSRRGKFSNLTARGESLEADVLRRLQFVALWPRSRNRVSFEMRVGPVVLLDAGVGAAELRFPAVDPPIHFLIAWPGDPVSRVVGHPLLERPEYLVKSAHRDESRDQLRVRFDMPEVTLSAR